MLVLAALVAAYGLLFFSVDNLNPDFVKRFEAIPVQARLHIYPGALALLLGAFQFSRRIRQDYKAWHVNAGRVYIVLVLLSALGGLLLAVEAHGQHAVTRTGFSVLAVLWIVSAVMAYIHARNHRFNLHKQWMIRNYALTLAAVSLRIELGVLQFVFDLSFDEAYMLIAWLAWVPNLVVAEWLFLPWLTSRD